MTNSPMDSERLAKYLFIAVSAVTVSSALVGVGMVSAQRKWPIFVHTHSLYTSLLENFSEVEETSVLRPTSLLQPARYKGAGVTINEVPDAGEYVLLSGFFGEDSEIRLIRRDGTQVSRWPLSFSEIFRDASYLSDPPATDWNVDTHGAIAMPDGSIVFNFDYTGMARIDRCGKVLWTLKRQTHHSVERAESGGFWVPGQRFVKSEKNALYPPFDAPYADSTIMHVSEAGKVLREFSIVKVFYDNGLEALLTAAAIFYEARPANAWNREIVHLNKVSELSSALAPDFPMFEAGDLLLSFRNLNMLMVVSPRTLKVKWWRVGPWLRQHDAEFRAGGSVMVFNNNIYLTTAFKSGHDRTTKLTRLTVPRVSNVLELNVATGQSHIFYGGSKEQPMLSVTRGKVDPMANGDVLVTEFDGGRVFEANPAGEIVWQYINRYDEDEVAEITEARVYPAGYFDSADFSCATRPSN